MDPRVLKNTSTVKLKIPQFHWLTAFLTASKVQWCYHFFLLSKSTSMLKIRQTWQQLDQFSRDKDNVKISKIEHLHFTTSSLCNASKGPLHLTVRNMIYPNTHGTLTNKTIYTTPKTTAKILKAHVTIFSIWLKKSSLKLMKTVP